MVRVCPRLDLVCPYGDDCPLTIDRYTCRTKEQVLDEIGNAIRAALFVLDGSETRENGETVINDDDMVALEKALDVLEAYPDEPGVICGPADGAQYMMKRLMK